MHAYMHAYKHFALLTHAHALTHAHTHTHTHIVSFENVHMLGHACIFSFHKMLQYMASLWEPTISEKQFSHPKLQRPEPLLLTAYA